MFVTDPGGHARGPTKRDPLARTTRAQADAQQGSTGELSSDKTLRAFYLLICQPPLMIKIL